MLTQTEGRIYLADKRGVTTRAKSSRYHTFNNEQYFDESRMPFGILKVLNEEVLSAGEMLNISFEQNTTLILLPLVGGLSFRFNDVEPEYIVAGQAMQYVGKTGEIYEVENPYSEELISFLQIQISVREVNSDTSSAGIVNLTLENKNQLFAFGVGGISIFIGQYDGRSEGFYQLKNPENGLFTFIIEGAFEVQNRLLETKDALALWNLASDVDVEFEALSNNAIILFIEVQLN